MLISRSLTARHSLHFFFRIIPEVCKILKMKRFSLFLFCILLFAIAHAQPGGNLIKGTVTDSASGKGLQFATVTLYAAGNKTPVTGAIADKTGGYTLNDIKEGNYSLLIECIGYKPITIPDITISKTHPLADLKTTRLANQHTALETVVVTAQTKTIENKIDRLVFNAEKDISSQSGTASDILKKVPQVSVDADGNVQLAGSSGIKFLINGKPSTAFGSSIADVLQSIPGSQIKSIEVITNPGAKYDAQGLGGIINIILKNNTAKGYNGNLSLTAGTRQENGSLNLNARKNNFGANAFFSGNKRLRSSVPYHSDRYTAGSSGTDHLHQEGEGRFERQGYQTGAGFDWTVKKLNSISGSVSYNHFGNNGSGFTYQDLEYSAGSGIAPVLTQINATNKFSFANTDLGLNYKRSFKKEDRELEFSFDRSFGKGNTASTNEQFYLPQKAFYYGLQNNNPGKTKETEITADYTEPLAKDIMLGTGAKAAFYNINSNTAASQSDQLSPAYTPNASLSNNLIYKQKVYAAYAELSFPVSKTINAKAGGRYERTELNSYFSNAQQQANIPGYNTFVPSLFISKKINDAQTIKLSYSKRIERPDYNELNPFVNTTDPKNLSTGNPFLLPELGHRIEFSYNRDFGKTGSAMINLFYRINEHDIQSYVFYYPSYAVGDSVFTNVSVSTRQNIGSEKNLGMNIFGDLHPNSKLGLRGNIFFFRRHTINTIDKGYNTNSFNYRFNINASYQFTKTFLAEFFGNFNSARNEAQGRYPSFTTYSLALRKQFWNKKGSIALTANNFISKYVDQKTVLSSPSFSSVNFRQIPFRSVGINFAWKFGKLEFKKTKPEGDNMPAGGE